MVYDWQSMFNIGGLTCNKKNRIYDYKWCGATFNNNIYPNRPLCGWLPIFEVCREYAKGRKR